MGKLSLKEEQKFGIEIEYIDVALIDVKRAFRKEYLYDEGWIVKGEETIVHDLGSDYAGEVTSPIASNNPVDLYHLERVCDLLYKIGAQTDSRCGAHIHFDAERFNIDNVRYLQNLMLILTCYEDVIYKYARGEDESIRSSYRIYANTIHDNYDIDFIKKYFFDYISREEFETAIFKKFNKNFGINFCNLTTSEKVGMNTIEFRMLNGTINSDLWLNNINTFGLMLEQALNMNFETRNFMFERIKHEFNTFNIDRVDDDKAMEFISLIAKCDEDVTRFMKQYEKQINKRYIMI